MHHFFITLLVSSLNAIHGSNLRENDFSMSDTARTETKNTGFPILQGLINYFQDKKPGAAKEKKSAQNKTDVLNNLAHEKNFSIRSEQHFSKFTKTTENIGRHFHMDPVFNSLKNRRLNLHTTKKDSSSSSSEMEVQLWMDDWGEKRMQQKIEAMNSPQPRGDVVNMKAARPWGVQCGDPNQHDLPWGTCMLPAECDAEYRIYRGDSFCGRTMFVCCALERTSYDMYQALDMSFHREDSLSTDTEEENDLDPRKAKHREHKKRRNEKRKHKRNKDQLNKKIRNSIANVITEITKLLQKAYRNGTAHRASKSRELKEFIKKMKIQYRKDRKTLVDAHEFNMANYAIELENSLGKVKGVNQAFMTNDTFRDIVVNGTVNKKNLMRLQRTHPVLSLFYNHRRMGGGESDPKPEKIKPETEEELPELERIELETEEEVPEPERIKLETEEEVPDPAKKTPKILDYDVEYGMLYY